MSIKLEMDKTKLLRIADQIGDLPVVLYGAGKYGRIALANIRKYIPKLNIKYYVDDDRVRNNEAVEGVEVVSLLDAIEYIESDFYILITNYYVKPVIEKIEQVKFDLSKVLFCNELLIEDVDPEMIEQNKGKMLQVYNMLEDYQSKIIYRTAAESRFTKDIDVLTYMCEPDQYFLKEKSFELTEEEVFVDAGAFIGDTIEAFLKQINNKYKYIYAFEPDINNYQKLNSKFKKGNILTFNAGLYNSTTELSFAGNKGGVSKVEKNGKAKVQVYQFDTLDIPDKNISFVKMDIEGSELMALHGMAKTIQNCKPKLAICIYHKYEDLWKLPLYIKELVPEYKLYMRNYLGYLDEIVLYATI